MSFSKISPVVEQTFVAYGTCSGSLASNHKSCATIKLQLSSSTAPPRRMIRYNKAIQSMLNLPSVRHNLPDSWVDSQHFESVQQLTAMVPCLVERLGRYWYRSSVGSRDQVLNARLHWKLRRHNNVPFDGLRHDVSHTKPVRRTGFQYLSRLLESKSRTQVARLVQVVQQKSRAPTYALLTAIGIPRVAP